MTQILTIRDVEQEGRRLDNFLLSQLKGVPKSLIYRLIRQGHIRVNKKRAKSSYRIHLSDEIHIPDIQVTPQHKIKLSVKNFEERLKNRILFENDQLLIINKPFRMAVHGGSGVSYGLIETLRMIRPEAHFLELVHRLDKETSGCLIIAKKRTVLRKLHELLRNHQIQKEYLALTLGHWAHKKNRVDLSLKKRVLRSGERMVEVSESGKKSLSEFHLIKRYPMADLVKVQIATGRTHQIRVHAAQMGHPIAGDQKYGDATFNQKLKEKGLKRLFLHASRLSFELEPHQTITAEAPLDQELEEFLDLTFGI
ncbi:MAG: RluA family pseudouridine synthase [Gammaproteobacteria bacterium]|nr:RluA family pseudouridine synthase [Gammaproteobacteria bacterium]